MLTDEGAIKVLDFGLAKLVEKVVPECVAGLEAPVTHATTEGRFVGTPNYVSPEQARGQAVDQRSDLFSFGVMLYEMLAGQHPFEGRAALDVMMAIVGDEPPPVSKLNPEVSPELSRIVQRCLAKEAGERYDDCRSLAGDLDRVLATGAKATPTKAARWRPRLAWALGTVAAIALAGAGAGRLRPKVPSVALAPSASALAPAATAITDLPLPASKSPEAVTAYAAALQALRDANWGRARADLRRALTLD
jgi:serine/threonine-protein kinase